MWIPFTLLKFSLFFLLKIKKVNFRNYLKEIFAQNFSKDSEEILFVSSQMWEGNLAETSHITTIGNILYTSYPMWLIITSIILLLAMVGAIVITIKK